MLKWILGIAAFAAAVARLFFTARDCDRRYDELSRHWFEGGE